MESGGAGLDNGGIGVLVARDRGWGLRAAADWWENWEAGTIYTTKQCRWSRVLLGFINTKPAVTVQFTLTRFIYTHFD